MPKHGIKFVGTAARKVQPGDNRLLLEDGEHLDYDYLVIASGPRLAFDEIPGLGPHGGYTQSVCKTEHASVMAGKPPTHHATWNAFCLADFGDRGVAFIALPQIPPRNTNWSGQGNITP